MNTVPVALVTMLCGAIITTILPTQESNDPKPIVTDRPDQTESSLTIPRGMIQVEAGWSFTQDNESGGRLREHGLPELLVRIGAGSRLELRAGFGGWRRNQVLSTGGTVSSNGAGDIEAGFKYRLAEGRGTRPGVAFLADVALPTGTAGFSGEQVSPVARLSFSHELSDAVGTGYNIGVSIFQGAGGAVAAEALYTWTAGFAVAGGLGAFVEAFGTVGLSNGESRASVDGGFTIQFRHNIQLDLSGGIGLTRNSDDWFVGSGLSVRVPR